MNPHGARNPGGRIASHGATSRWPVRYPDGLRIELYTTRYRAQFERINRAWIEQYFRIEPDDARILADPEAPIVAPGGDVLFACLDERAVGTVALRPRVGGAELPLDPAHAHYARANIRMALRLVPA